MPGYAPDPDQGRRAPLLAAARSRSSFTYAAGVSYDRYFLLCQYMRGNFATGFCFEAVSEQKIGCFSPPHSFHIFYLRPAAIFPHFSLVNLLMLKNTAANTAFWL